MERALNRVLVDKPSMLARSLVNDMCKQQLNCLCCPANVSFMWKRQLSSSVRAGIARETFDRANFNSIIQLADDIHSNTNAPTAVVAAVRAPNLDETQPAIPYAAPEVAAVRGGNSRGRGRGRGN